MSDQSIQIGYIGELTSEEVKTVPTVKELKAGLFPSSLDRNHSGRMPQPVLFQNAILMMFTVSTHQVCIHTKRDAVFGLGFESKQDREKRAAERAAALAPQPAPGKNPVATAKEMAADLGPSKVDKALDDLCEVSFQHLMDQVGEDYMSTGNGYIEVVRDGHRIASMWHVPAPSVHVFLEGEGTVDSHFESDGPHGVVKFSKFGEEERARVSSLAKKEVTELIQFKKPTCVDPYYGLPDWLGAVTWLELAQNIMATEHDFYANRAVPDLMVFVNGARMPDKEFAELKTAIKNTVGTGKRFRSLAVNLPSPEIKVQVERLGNESREKISESWPSVEMAIVSSHRVPPLLAGIVTPGKMAAANELPNALVAFQTLYVSQHQKIIQRVLGKTLGQEPGLGLGPDDFLCRRITDFYDLGQMDTMSRMRAPAAEAQASGRNLKDGLKE